MYDETRDGRHDVPSADASETRPTGDQPSGTREARLRPEYAAHYPGVEPDHWMPALRLVSAADHDHTQGKARLSAEHRLPGEHFDFRGGDARGPTNRLRTRLADRDVLH